MAKQTHDAEDARVFRITARTAADGGTFTKEVTALYWQNEQGFIIFKDLGHSGVYTIAAERVLEIERLRTHVILAIASEELDLILGALREQAVRLGDDPRDSITAREAQQVAALAESLERLRPIAALRESEDVSSLPRVLAE
jgi:hypothetical protein